MPELEDVFVVVVGVLVGGESVVSFDVGVGVVTISPEWVGDIFFDEFPVVLVEVLGSYLISNLNLLKFN